MYFPDHRVFFETPDLVAGDSILADLKSLSLRRFLPARIFPSFRRLTSSPTRSFSTSRSPKQQPPLPFPAVDGRCLSTLRRFILYLNHVANLLGILQKVSKIYSFKAPLSISHRRRKLVNLRSPTHLTINLSAGSRNFSGVSRRSLPPCIVTELSYASSAGYAAFLKHRFRSFRSVTTMCINPLDLLSSSLQFVRRISSQLRVRSAPTARNYFPALFLAFPVNRRLCLVSKYLCRLKDETLILVGLFLPSWSLGQSSYFLLLDLMSPERDIMNMGQLLLMLLNMGQLLPFWFLGQCLVSLFLGLLKPIRRSSCSCLVVLKSNMLNLQRFNGSSIKRFCLAIWKLLSFNFENSVPGNRDIMRVMWNRIIRRETNHIHYGGNHSLLKPLMSGCNKSGRMNRGGHGMIGMLTLDLLFPDSIISSHEERHGFNFLFDERETFSATIPQWRGRFLMCLLLRCLGVFQNTLFSRVTTYARPGALLYPFSSLILTGTNLHCISLLGSGTLHSIGMSAYALQAHYWKYKTAWSLLYSLRQWLSWSLAFWKRTALRIDENPSFVVRMLFCSRSNIPWISILLCKFIGLRSSPPREEFVCL
ncbi:predicted protein [Arabidopsis lyrata subsp. lyrata]|uniref:Predicted protein n=1 Tax=Arabidopsis lyrata subsp. lyrata TaxID=81972 RepID=D7LYK4_ARALL|nr:predicted protein [Arabidopsis lyrata subsp. lyrata]